VPVADSASFDAFFRASYDRTLRYLYGMLGNTSVAQDLAQEAYGRAWRRWGSVGEMDDPEAWVRTVAWRLGADHFRHLRVAARRLAVAPQDAAPGEPGVENVALVAALKRIDPAQRQAVVLHYLLDLPLQQVAKETGVSLSAAKSRLARGRVALLAHLDPQEVSDV
jgi:RNA polymerase sigma-70 factor (ECF subfamily)